MRLRRTLALIAAAVPALALAAPAEAGTVSPLASGGGCRQTTGGSASVCISYRGSEGRVYMDFYVNSWGSVQKGAHAVMYVTINGQEERLVDYQTDWIGHYGPVSRSVGGGNAYTSVDFFNPSGSYDGGDSWVVSYP